MNSHLLLLWAEWPKIDVSANMFENCLRIHCLTKFLVISFWAGIFKRKNFFQGILFTLVSIWEAWEQPEREENKRGKKKREEKEKEKVISNKAYK